MVVGAPTDAVEADAVVVPVVVDDELDNDIAEISLNSIICYLTIFTQISNKIASWILNILWVFKLLL